MAQEFVSKKIHLYDVAFI